MLEILVFCIVSITISTIDLLGLLCEILKLGSLIVVDGEDVYVDGVYGDGDGVYDDGVYSDCVYGDGVYGLGEKNVSLKSINMSEVLVGYVYIEGDGCVKLEMFSLVILLKELLKELLK